MNTRYSRTTALRVAILCIRLAKLCEDKDPRKAAEFYAGAWEQFAKWGGLSL